jgi:hypothetical protein
VFDPLAFQVLHISARVMTTILKRAADRGEGCRNIRPRIVTLPTDLFRKELFRARTPAPKGVLTELVDDVFLALVRP